MDGTDTFGGAAREKRPVAGLAEPPTAEPPPGAAVGPGFRRKIDSMPQRTYRFSAGLLLILCSAASAQGVITEYSTGLTASSTPYAIVKGPDGNLWFTEEYVNQIGRINPTTGAITEYSTGMTPGNTPKGIAVGSDGNLWFTEYGSSAIERINPSTGVITQYTTGLTFGCDPVGIVAGPDGNLWFAELNNYAIGRINPTTGVITEYHVAAFGSQPFGVAPGPDGNLWYTLEVGRIGKINPSTGAVTEYSTGLSAGSTPQGIVAGPDGNLWFVEYNGNRIGKINPSTGAIAEYPLPNAGSQPEWIAAGPDGYLWFPEWGGNRIGRINPTTGAIAEYPLPNAGSGPEGIAVGPDGNLWFTEWAGNRIGRITAGVTSAAVPTLSQWGMLLLTGLLAGAAALGLRRTARRRSSIVRISAVLAVCALAALPTGSATGSTATYQFVGTCSDCTGTGVGLLTLQNYTLGQPLTWANFVGFTYTSNKNPIPAGISPSTTNFNSSSILSGSLPATLPASATVSLGWNGNNYVLETLAGSGAYWCVGVNGCQGDYGFGGTWSLVGSTSVPVMGVPTTIVLAAILGLLGAVALGMHRKRRGATYL